MAVPSGSTAFRLDSKVLGVYPHLWVEHRIQHPPWMKRGSSAETRGADGTIPVIRPPAYLFQKDIFKILIH
jgi:hypothetical protein